MHAPDPGVLRAEPPYAWEDLLGAAGRFARSAASNYSRDDAPFFYLHAGASVELIIKSVLCRNSPVLLLEGNRFSEASLLRLAGFQPVASSSSKPPPLASRRTTPHTVGFSKAIERLGLLYGPDFLGVSADQLDQLKSSRDLVAHGSASAEDASETMHEVLVTFGSVCTPLLGVLDVSRETYWGDSANLIERALDSQRDALGRRVDTLYAAAQARYESQFRGIDPAALQSLKEEAYWSGWGRGVGSRTCPICGAQGWSHERPELRQHHDRRGRLVLEPGFQAMDFRCPVCKLNLDSEQMVRAARNFEPWEEEVSDISYWVDEFGVENLDPTARKALGADWYDAALEDDADDVDPDTPAS
jgi:hypothetical protein